MIRSVAVLALLISSSAFAHVKLGFYDGVTLDRQPCAVEFKAVNFEGGVHNPYNERVTVSFAGSEWTLSHSAKVDLEASSLSFEGGKLSSVKGTANGAQGLAIEMVHTPTQAGPARATLIEEVKTADTVVTTIMTCDGLHHRD